VFAGGWRQLIHANQINSFVVPGVDFPASITWKPDGTKFILLVAAATDFIQEFTVPTPWSTTGAVAGATFNINPPESNPRGMYITLDGTQCFIAGTGVDRVLEISMPTAWDVSTMSFTGKEAIPVGVDGAIQGMTFSKSGLRCYLTDSGDDLMEYELTTPFDLDTFNDIAINGIDISLHSENPRDVLIKPDGKIIYIIGEEATKKNISRYELTVPGDISTASFVDQLDIDDIADNPQGLFIRQNDGKKLYMLNGNDDTIFTFDMSLATNNAIINNDGDELTTVLGDTLVAA